MLLYYCRRGALPLGKMGDRLQVHRTSVTNIIDGLERSGYVTREPHERDRRTTLAAITPRGREVAATATPVLNGLKLRDRCRSRPPTSRRSPACWSGCAPTPTASRRDAAAVSVDPALLARGRQHRVGEARGAQAVREDAAGRRAARRSSIAA